MLTPKERGRLARGHAQFNKFRRQQREANLAISTEVRPWLEGWAIVKGNVFDKVVLAQFATRDEAVAAFRDKIVNGGGW